MKIAFINHVLILGDGISTVIWNLAKCLAKEHDVTIFTFFSNYNDGSGVQVRELGIPFRKKKLVNPTLLPLFQGKWQEIRKRLRQYDVVNTHLYPANFIPLFPTRVKGPLHIYTEWSTARHTTPYEALYNWFANRVNKYVARHVDRVLAPSLASERYVKDRYGVVPHQVFLDGVDFSLFNKETVSRATKHNPLPSLSGRPNILFVGQAHPHKGIEMLIRSLKVVRREIPDAGLTIVGRVERSTSYYHYLQKLVKEEGLQDSVIFTGTVSWEELPRYYAACDVYATCSLWEGFLRAEAYAMEKPMVAFDVAANSETIKHAETGLLVKEQSP